MSFPPVIKRLNDLEGRTKTNEDNLTAHGKDKNNPHGLTAAKVGAYTKLEIDEMLAGFGGGGLSTVETITASGNWTPKKTGVHFFVLIGGGGGGGGGIDVTFTTKLPYSGAGGGGGGCFLFWAEITSPAALPVVIGAGGAAGCPAVGTTGLFAKGGGETSIVIGGVKCSAGGGGGGGGIWSSISPDNPTPGGGPGGAGGGPGGDGNSAGTVNNGGAGIVTTAFGGVAGTQASGTALMTVPGGVGGQCLWPTSQAFGKGGDGAKSTLKAAAVAQNTGIAGRPGCLMIFY